MPLSKPARRVIAHQRTVNCNGYQREDGLWDIEGHMQDVKSKPIDNPERGGYVAAGEPFHNLGLRITIDQTLLIHSVEAYIDASPFRMCPGVVGVFKKLEGTRIGPGWQRQSKELLGGVQGCTHLSELLMPIATTAVQTLWPSAKADVMKLGAQVMLNTCRTWAQDSEVIKTYLPELYNEELPT